MQLVVRGIPSEAARRLRTGGPDANGQTPLRQPARGLANPCRHCLQLITEGEDMLIVSYRPFTGLQPYAETGPIFLHAHDCSHYEADVLPAWFHHLSPALIRGYGEDDWIRYETADVLPGAGLAAACMKILTNPQVAYVHVRSKFNCFQCRVERA